MCERKNFGQVLAVALEAASYVNLFCSQTKLLYSSTSLVLTLQISVTNIARILKTAILNNAAVTFSFIIHSDKKKDRPSSPSLP